MSPIDTLKAYLAIVRDMLLPDGSLGERTVKSGIWASATKVTSRGLSLLALVILARLLDPSDFGLMGIALLSLTGLKQFSQLGLNTALIQHQSDDVDEYLDTAWTMQVVRGVVLAAILAAAAPFVAGFFDMPRATPILRAIALSPLLYGFWNPGVIYFRKSLEFHKNFAFEASGAVMRFVVSVGYALAYPSVWALVFGYLTADVVRLFVSYLLHDHRPRPALDLTYARELFGYGKWITGTGMLYYLFNQGDDVVVGWLLAASALGFYQVAYQLSNSPATEVTHVISAVIFPMFSKIQTDTDRLRTAFFRTLRIVTLVSFPMAVGILAVARPFVAGIMGEQWLPMVTTIQILAVFGLARSFGATFGTVFKAVGRPDLTTKLQFFNVVLLAAFIFPATDAYGIEGAAAAVLAAYLIKVVVGAHLLVGTVETTYGRLFRTFLYPFAASATMGVAVVAVGEWFPLQSETIEFVLLVGIGIGAYLVAIVVIDRMSTWGIRNEMATVVRTVRG